MKLLKLSTLAMALAVTMVTQAHAQTLITGFGNSPADFSLIGASGLATTASASTFEVSGTDGGSNFLGSISSPVSVGNPLTLQLTALLTNSSVATSTFQIEILDSNFNGLIYTGSFNSFTKGVNSTITLNFLGTDNNIGPFSGTVGNIAFNTSGGGQFFDLTFDTLTTSAATPEPSSIALLVIGGLVLVGGARAFRKANA